MTHTIVCRARVSPNCYHGRPTSVQFGDDDPMTADGTYLPNEDGGSLVCDACYIAIGTPNNGPELENAIRTAQLAAGAPAAQVPAGMLKCPGCEVMLPEGDTHAQKAHMEAEHPDIIQARLRQAGMA